MTYSIIQKSQLEGALRMDAEYYQPEFLDIIKKISKHKVSQLKNVLDDIRYGLYVEPDYQEEGVNFLRALNLVDYGIDGEVLKIKEKEIPSKKYLLNQGDILIVRSGANTGNVGIIEKYLENSTFGSYTICLRTIKINPYFLYVFFNSKFGKLQTLRLQTGMAQPNLNIPNIEEIKIPLDIKKELQEEIEKIVLNAFEIKENSKFLYSQAENLLLEELGILSFVKVAADKEKFSIVALSEVKSAKRMDAEYFQPKYEKLEARIKKYGAKKLEIFIKDYSTGFPFKSENYQEEGIPLIRINNIKKGFLDLSDATYLSEKDYLLSPKDTAKSGDIVLSMSGTIGMSAVIPDNMPKSSVNQRILRFTPQDIDNDYLVLLLNSIVGFYQLERIGTGGVQTNISYKDIKNILIPDLSKPTQRKIAELVRQSHEVRKKARDLLEEAKRKVEDMIEEN